MISNRNPESMTSDERRDEIASILAGGLLRCVRNAKANPDARETGSPKPEIGLDLPLETRLSVAQRPAG